MGSSTGRVLAYFDVRALAVRDRCSDPLSMGDGYEPLSAERSRDLSGTPENCLTRSYRVGQFKR